MRESSYIAFTRQLKIDRVLACASAFDRDRNLTDKLQQIRVALPVSNDLESFYQWWQACGPQWIEQLRQVIIEHRNIKHNWQFTNEHQHQLERYYEANKFLVALMNIEGAVSEDVHSEIEDTLLLPWAELHRRQPGLYPDLE